MFIKGCKEFVEMTHFVNPTEFYVQRSSTSRILEELEADIATFIEINPPKPEEITLSKRESYFIYYKSNAILIIVL